MTDVFPDPGTEFGARVAQRLRDETVVWLTTVGADGTPQPNPVWFLADGATMLVYNQPFAKRLAHIRRNPRVALNFDGDRHGGNIVVLTGRAEILDNQPLSHEVPAYQDKYGRAAAQISGDVEAFSAEYSVAIRITIERVRGFLT
jgi:PPOX class probable F420-dependent enzyme